ncbi:uncharacterized protein LOC101855397 [Aplysia californica]|uniref:Uncharacterized protein LOC101855397 n=1 Tax=Aplysia californica TaxID=6500 RepID=A0ABM0KAW7_APLCA|nr:uncharacterized protein LOC101855397 [Aplysia californica]
MDGVFTHQQKTARALQRQLSGLDNLQRLSEARHRREILNTCRELGRIHQASLDLDDVLAEIPNRHQQRRVSLPVTSLTDSISPPISPRFTRRRGSIPANLRSPSAFLERPRRGSDASILPEAHSRLQLDAILSKGRTPRSATNNKDNSKGSTPRSSTNNKDNSKGSSSARAKVDPKGSSSTKNKDDLKDGNTVNSTTAMSVSTQSRRDSQPLGGVGRPGVTHVGGNVTSGAARRNSAGNGRRGSDEMMPPSVAPPGTHALHHHTGSGSQPIKNGSAKKRNSLNSSVSSTTVEVPPEHHHMTCTFVHTDEDDDDPLSIGGSPPKEESMFESHKRNHRRASEPGIGSHFLRVMQDKAFNSGSDDEESGRGPSPSRQHSTPESEALKKSIKTSLPSDIVAEEDEEGAADDAENNDNAVAASNLKKTTATAASRKAVVSSASKKLSVNLASVPEKKSEEEESKAGTTVPKLTTTKGKQNGGTSGGSPRKNSKDASAGNSDDNSKDKASFAQLRSRRKSEGDVLRFARVLRLQAERAKSSKNRNKESQREVDPAVKEQERVWEAVRKCRYIRGYEPPEMEEPEDLGEFVFGHRPENQEA